MEWFKKQSIGLKLLLSYSIIVLIIIFIGFQSISRLSTMGSIIKDLVEVQISSLDKIKEVDSKIYNIARVIRDYLVAENLEEREKQIEKMNNLKTDARKILNEIKALPLLDNEIKQLSKTVEDFENYIISAEKVILVTNASPYINL